MHIVSQDQFPTSSTMTGAILLINPGGLRELHWHSNAAEWQYYVRGKARMTVFGSHGRARTDEFGAGDVGYVPQGFGHYIENIGDEELKIVIVFNNATYKSIRSRPGWPPIPIACSPPISACRRKFSRKCRRGRSLSPSSAKFRQIGGPGAHEGAICSGALTG